MGVNKIFKRCVNQMLKLGRLNLIYKMRAAKSFVKIGGGGNLVFKGKPESDDKSGEAKSDV